MKRATGYQNVGLCRDGHVDRAAEAQRRDENAAHARAERMREAAPDLYAMVGRLANAADSLAEHGNLNFADQDIAEARALLAKLDACEPIRSTDGT